MLERALTLKNVNALITCIVLLAVCLFFSNAVFVDAHLHGSVKTVVDLDADQNLQLYVSLNDSLVGSLKVCLIPCLHDQANIEQMYSKYTC